MIIAVLIVLIIIILISRNQCREQFITTGGIDPYTLYNPLYDPSSNCYENVDGQMRCVKNYIYRPYMYYPARHTRNMSYDIRDEPVIQPKSYLWLNSDFVPYYR